MSDQCKHCECIRNLTLCERTECFIRESWYSLELQMKVDSMRTDLAALEAAVREKEKDIIRFADRDGRSTIQLIWPQDNDPFSKIDLKICDFGVSDNIYVVESKELLERIAALEAAVREKETACNNLLRNQLEEMNEMRQQIAALTSSNRKMRDQMNDILYFTTVKAYSINSINAISKIAQGALREGKDES